MRVEPVSGAILHDLYREAAAYVATRGPRVAAFAGALPSAPEQLRNTANRLPAGADLASTARHASAETATLVQAACRAAPRLGWLQGYAEAEVGADYLSRSGWCHLAGPEGPLVLPGLRMFLGYWGGGLVYPSHRHPPEEVYLPLAGRALFFADGRKPRMAGPGDAVFHAADQPHATTFGPQGFLALILWRGPDLAVRLAMAERGAAG